MASCPNKSLPEWKELVALKGESTAYYLWFNNDGDVSKFTSSGKKNSQTISVVNDFLNRIGVSVEGVDKIVIDGVKQNSNGVALIAQKLIQIVNGKEDVALVEEAMHFSVEIVQQKDPTLFNKLLKEITNYQIYKDVNLQYIGHPDYTLPDGKPDVIKLKKEAIAKLLAATLKNKIEGRSELTEKASLSISLLDQILDYLRGLFNTSGFDKMALSVLDGSFEGSVEDLRESGLSIYHQIETKNAVDAAYDVANDINKRTIRYEATDDKKRHYKFDDVESDYSVTELLDDGKEYDRSPEDKLQDNDKMLWGSAGHEFIQDYTKANLIDDDGYILDEYITDDVATQLAPTIQSSLVSYLKSKLDLYKLADLERTDGARTRIMIEGNVFNPSVTHTVNKKTKKVTMASAVDFRAFVPDDKVGVKVDTFDWKFVNINKDKDEDIPWYKRAKWNKQMNQYVDAYLGPLFGLKQENIGVSHMIPILANYSYVNIRDKKNSRLYLSSIEIGDVDNKKINNVYLLPVPIETESTGNSEIDDLLIALRNQYEKLYKVSPIGDKQVIEKNIQLNQLSIAIRELHVKLDFGRLASVGASYINDVSELLKTFKDIDYSSMTPEASDSKIKEIVNYENSIIKFQKLDDIFLSKFDTYDLDEASQKQVVELRELSRSVKAINAQIKDLYNKYAIYQAITNKIISPGEEDSVIEAEKEVIGMSRTFLEGTKLNSVVLNIATQLVLKVKSLTRINTNREINKFVKLLNIVETQAKSLGKTAFDLIATNKDGKLRLMSEMSADFWKQYDEAIVTKDRGFFLENMDKATYNVLVKEFIDKNIAIIKDKQFSKDPDRNDLLKQEKLLKVKRLYEINSEEFSGFGDFHFKKFFMASLQKDKWYSDDYKKLKTNKNALALWEYMHALNVRAKAMGYLGKNDALSFFPLIEASFMNKVIQSGNLGKESMDFFKTFYQVQVEEEQKFSKLDPETKKVTKEVPKFFTSVNGREVTKFSTDLNKVGIMWIGALMDYESRIGLENTLLVLHKVETAKGSVVVNEHDEPVLDARGNLLVDLTKNSNADLLQDAIDTHVYNLQQDDNSWGNVQLNTLSNKIAGGDETKREVVNLNVKKALSTTNAYIQSLALGLKASIAIPNWFGYNFQAFINGGQFYSFAEFTKNNIKSTSGIGWTIAQKALLDLFVPLNENLVADRIRSNAKTQSYSKWLASWNFNDVMMVSMSWPERKLQMANAMSFLDNTVIINNRIENARKYLAEQDRLTKYKMTQAERRQLEKTFESRVEQLKKDKSIQDVAIMQDDELVIPGVSDADIADLRIQMVEFGRNLNGQMSEDNKAKYRRDIIFTSFMMFKNWMPKQISLRALDIKKNVELGSWEYGRTRLLLKTIAHLGTGTLTNMRGIIIGNDAGLAIMRTMLEQKKEAYLKKHGKVLTISEEEFFDMMRSALSSQMKELSLLLGMMALVIGAAVVGGGDDDDDDLQKNRMKYFAKLINKTSDEVSFYYNPLTFQSVTNGSLLPALGLTNKVWSIFKNVSKDIYGYSSGDEEVLKTTHSIKAIIDVIPILSQFQKEYLASIYPELAKELGVRVTAESRAGR